MRKSANLRSSLSNITRWASERAGFVSSGRIIFVGQALFVNAPFTCFLNRQTVFQKWTHAKN